MFTVIAHVRTRGSIGIFYPIHFSIPTNNEYWKEEWFKLHGGQWELHHFGSGPVTA